MSIPTWSPKSPQWGGETFDLLIQSNIKEPETVKLCDIIEKSDNFPIKFPIETGRCQTLKNHVESDVLERNINSAYPVIHENALELCCKFILFKRKCGSNVEKAFYRDMDLKNFIDRLLTKRAVMFMGRFDSHLLLNGKKGSRYWETIGTDRESNYLKLKHCLSYDEIKLSVFLSITSYTYFVNIGDRRNMAKFAIERNDIADEGVIAGMIGPRLKKENVMEYQEMIFSPQQNTGSNGYGRNVSESIHKLFSEFYEEECLTYNECLELKNMLPNGHNRFTTLENDKLFDNHLYYKRLLLTFDTLLLEANARAKEKGTSAYIHVVGLGLGVWKASPHQEKVYMESFADRISALGSKLYNISDICFAYINETHCGNYKHGERLSIEGHPLSGIKIHIFKRNPHQT